MRILVVSAHYPPNFVSGGTLAPQRLALGLRNCGHDVSVYAGWLGDKPAPSGWTSTDSDGMAVRWFVTTPWLGWDDRNNYDNPVVTEDFARHLRQIAPEVVHFHSLQSLGVGLLRAASEAGARVVVTMHDFWWVCARQFLVTSEFRPCCLVVSCGVCPCEVDTAWLEARNTVLSRALSFVDLVLAVSPSSAEVLVANGVDPARLRVDENGVPEPPRPHDRHTSDQGEATSHGPRSGAVLRFTYTGGYHRMKGSEVLFQALAEMTDLPGWHVTVYGVESFVRNQRLSLNSLPVDVRPPFEPQDADSVFDETDVLVVPSVMRETYSLVTREALTRGIPVVCTDSLGPEEVVTHEVNGLVVPAADSRALAGALSRLVAEPRLVEKLRSGCGAVQVRSVEDQVTGLDQLFRELLARPAPILPPRITSPTSASPNTKGRVVNNVLFLVGIQGAPLRYRARLPAEALGLLGVTPEVRHYRDPETPLLAENADVLVVYRVPATVQVLDLITQVRSRGMPVYFDVDDLIFDPDLADEIPALTILPPEEATLWIEGVRRYRTTMEACDAFIGSTNELCRHAEEVVGIPAERFANGVGVVLGQLSDAALGRPRSPGPLRVGYFSGTNTHDHDWRSVEEVLVGLMEERSDLELWLVGLVQHSPVIDRFEGRVRRLPVVPWKRLPELLRDLDVNLAPLEPGKRFNDAKSAIKWLEAALTATPTVASPSEPFREAIRHGQNGMLADTTQEWESALRRLVDDEELRERLGRRARRDALLRWSPHVQAIRYLEILERQPPRRRLWTSSWAPLVHDEPFEPVALEPYLGNPQLLHRPKKPSVSTREHLRRARSLLSHGWRSLREEGLRPTVRGFLSFSFRRLPPVGAKRRRRV